MGAKSATLCMATCCCRGGVAQVYERVQLQIVLITCMAEVIQFSKPFVYGSNNNIQ